MNDPTNDRINELSKPHVYSYIYFFVDVMCHHTPVPFPQLPSCKDLKGVNFGLPLIILNALQSIPIAHIHQSVGDEPSGHTGVYSEFFSSYDLPYLSELIAQQFFSHNNNVRPSDHHFESRLQHYQESGQYGQKHYGAKWIF